MYGLARNSWQLQYYLVNLVGGGGQRRRIDQGVTSNSIPIFDLTVTK